MLDLFRLETNFLLKHPTLIMLACAFLGFGLSFQIQETGIGMELLNLNAPYRLAYFIGLTSQLALLSVAFFSAAILLRDREWRFDQMIGYTYSKKRKAVHYGMTLAAALGLGSMVAVALFVGTLWPAHQHRIGDHAFSAYLWPWLVFVLPNTFISAVFTWILCRFFQKPMAVYIGCVFLFSWCWMTLIVTQAPIFTIAVPTLAPALRDVLALADPFGMVAFFEQTFSWSPEEKNTQLFALQAGLLHNRILWTGLATLCTAYLWRSNEAALLSPPDQKRPKKAASKPSPQTHESMDLPRMEAKPSPWLGMGTIITHELTALYRSRAFQAFLLIWLMLMGAGILMVVGTYREYSGRYPTTSFLIAHAAEPFSAIAILGVTIFATAIFWRERRHHLDGILDGTPRANGAIFVGKLAALWSIPMGMIAMLIVTCVGFQWSQGYWRNEWSHYLSLFYFLGFPVMLQALLVSLVHITLLHRRAAHPLTGLLTSGIVLALLGFLARQQGVPTVLQFNQFPNLLRLHSEFMGYGMWGSLFHRHALLWGAFGVFVGQLCLWLWPRNGGTARRKNTSTALSVAATLWLGFAGLMHMETSKMRPKVDELRAKAAYEQNYGHFRSEKIPQVIAGKMEIDFFPSEKRYDLRGTATIINDTGRPLQDMLVTSKVTLESLQMDGADIQVQETGTHFNVYLIVFHETFAPDETRVMSYQMKRFSHPFAVDPGIASNGTYISQGDFEPLLGYADFLEISDNRVRKAMGLPPKPQLGMSAQGKFITRKRAFEAILSTEPGQTLVTSGRLMRQWREQDRQYAHYRSEQEIYPIVGYASARYVVHETTYRGTPILVYAHPDHRDNLEEMARAAKAVFAYCSEAFGPYPFDALRMIEVPAYHPFGGKASAGVVALSEDLFVQDFADGAPINNVARNTAHEVIHQWWGEMLAPKITEGQGVLIESITKYLEAVVLAELETQSMADRLMEYNRRRYFAGRSVTNDNEVPLLASGNQRYLCYGKGPVVFNHLRHLIGEHALNRSFKTFLDQHQHHMNGTLPDLLEILATNHPDLEPHIQALFEDTQLQSVEIKSVSAKPQQDGRFEVELEILAEGLRQDTVTLAVQSAVGTQTEEAIRIAPGLQKLRLMVGKRPRSVTLDPRVTLLDNNPRDNYAILDAP